MIFLIGVVLFILGTIFGSFGGVIIERAKEGFAWNERGKVFGGRSYCPGCDGKLLTWWQLIPLLGWLIQRGKCFRCNLPIPQWYCWIELIMGGIFVITGLGVLGFSDPLMALQMMGGELIGWLMVSRLLTLIIIHDLRTQELNLYAWVLLFVTSCMLIFTMDAPIWKAGFIGALVLVSVFGCIYMGAKRYATKKNEGVPTEGFGEGDVMVALLLGLLSGPLIAQWGLISSIQMIFVYLVLSSSLGIIGYLMSQGFVAIHDRKIPFLPAMIIAWWGIVVWQMFAGAIS